MSNGNTQKIVALQEKVREHLAKINMLNETLKRRYKEIIQLRQEMEILDSASRHWKHVEAKNARLQEENTYLKRRLSGKTLEDALTVREKR